jgi:LAO/AO transport system kinase
MKNSALNVMKGIDQPGQINDDLVSKLKSKKAGSLPVPEIIAGIRSGNRTILSQAITLVESSLPAHQEKAQEIIAECLKSQVSGARSQVPNPQPPFPSIRIGITGVPGVGKSTFIEAFGKHLISLGHKVSVLAIDPSSSRSKGSILGDKTRMEELSVDPNAFIRPSPSAGSLGGVARKTRETIILCEAAGFDVILVETVGVGQSETAVHGMVDFFLLLMLAGAGDELQGIKRGIIEMADAIFINKADGDNLSKARTAAAEYASALHLFPPPAGSGWIPVTGICSAATRMGIPEVWDTVEAYAKTTFGNGFFMQKRREQSHGVLMESIDENLKSHFMARKDVIHLMHQLEKEILQGTLNPYTASQLLMAKYFESK